MLYINKIYFNELYKLMKSFYQISNLISNFWPKTEFFLKE